MTTAKHNSSNKSLPQMIVSAALIIYYRQTIQSNRIVNAVDAADINRTYPCSEKFRAIKSKHRNCQPSCKLDL